MKKLIVILSLIFACCCIAIGYAAYTTEISIHGEASAKPQPKGVFIIKVEEVASQNVKDEGTTHIFPTNLNSHVNVSRSGSITYRITVENNTDATYWYREAIALEDLEGYQNNLIGVYGGVTIVTKDKLSDSSATFNANDWIPPHTVREFYAVYQFASGVAGQSISTLVNFSFGGRIASYGDDFLAILNDPERYPVLAGAFNDNYAKNGSTVLGNVGADEAFFDSLFGTDLKLDGKDVTVLIQRVDVDKKSTGDAYEPSGPQSCEYTLYVTTDDPTTGTPTVYAVSYTKQPDGTWVQIGELYEGTVSIGTYKDSNGKSYPSMNISSWEAVRKTYTVFTYKNQSVTYKVNEVYGNSYQQQKKIGELMSMQDQELYNQLNNHQILKDTYQILFVEQVGSSATEVLLLREAYDNAMRFYEMRNGGKEFRLDNTATRAELLSTVEGLAKAMEYYNQVHDSGRS